MLLRKPQHSTSTAGPSPVHERAPCGAGWQRGHGGRARAWSGSTVSTSGSCIASALIQRMSKPYTLSQKSIFSCLRPAGRPGSGVACGPVKAAIAALSRARAATQQRLSLGQPPAYKMLGSMPSKVRPKPVARLPMTRARTASPRLARACQCWTSACVAPHARVRVGGATPVLRVLDGHQAESAAVRQQQAARAQPLVARVQHRVQHGLVHQEVAHPL